MPSFDVVNYSLRPSKSIQRQLVFEGVRRLQTHVNLAGMAYIGFGSVWFTDFTLAHKALGIRDMVSIEKDEIGHRRAVFNAPYATVRVSAGTAREVLPDLYRDASLNSRPWLAWLDYDYEFDEAVSDDVRSIVENAPPMSIVLVTFNAMEMKYGKVPERPTRLRQVFGSLVPDGLPKGACKKERLSDTLATFAMDFMASVANDAARPGGYVPAVRIVYRDGAPMVTVGGILPARGTAHAVADLVGREDWACMPAKPIVAPHLTGKEASMLQSLLPRDVPLTREDVTGLGFDLEPEQIEAFQAYYRQYPSYAQILA